MATDRVFKTNKVIAIPFSGITSSQVLADAVGKTYQDISDVNWQRITLEWSITTITGTSPTVNFQGITTNDFTNGGATSDPLAKQADNSTNFQSGNQNATGRGIVGCGKFAANGATASNIGKFLGVIATLGGTVTALAGTLFLYVEGQ